MWVLVSSGCREQLRGRRRFTNLQGLRWAFLGLWLACCPWPAQAEPPVTLTIENAQTAGLDGRAWDQAFPNATTFDAVHRAVLLRFPGAAEQIAAHVQAGHVVTKAEVRLTFAGHESSPTGYANNGDTRIKNAFDADPPRWHVVAWPLRRPWTADEALAPTFNAYLPDAGYWKKYGARDTQADRFADSLPPAELSFTNTEARLDVTALLAGEAYGETLGQRLRRFADQGLLLQKWELYDAHYHTHPTVPPQRAYEWIVGVGGCGLTFKAPALVVTLEPAKQTPVELPPATDLPALAARLRATGTGGHATAVMPSDEEIKAMAHRVFCQPAWMPAWQWQRVQELQRLSGSVSPRDIESGDPQRYRQKIAELLATQPRQWFGWGTVHQLLIWYLYRDLLPAPVQDHIRLYWESQLMPDRPTSQFGHMQQVDWDGGRNLYYERTRDWRGNHSFFRGPYTQGMSTMNFNHTASMGALLGGAIIDSEYAIGDGRYGLENLVLRLWSSGGSSQESMEPSYFPITLMAQKMFADFGPTPYDRLIGRLVVARNVDEVAAAYHPGLRRIIYPIGRTAIDGMLVSNSGLNHIMHTMSRSGALLTADLKDTKVGGMAVIAPDAPPDGIAYQTLGGPWMPTWCTNMVDEKPLPFSITTGSGGGTKRNYLGHHYGVASTLLAEEMQVAPVMAQWKRVPGQAQSATELGSFTLNYWLGAPAIRHQYGQRVEAISTLQHDNKLVVMMTPKNLAGRKDVSALLGAITFFTEQPTPTWEIFVDGIKAEQLPVRCKQGQRITIKDGVSYLGIIPLPATDLGRDQEVVLSPGSTYEGHTSALYLSSYNLRQDAPLDPATTDWATIQEAVAGFVIELGDESEDGSFAGFQKQFAAAALTTEWDAGQKTYRVAYQNGPDRLEAVHLPAAGQFASTAVNGQNPHPPAGIGRDSAFSQIGSTGRLVKNGSVLLSEPGRSVWLQTEPRSGVVSGVNMLPDPNLWQLQVANAAGTDAKPIVLRPDGRVGLLRADVSPDDNTITLQYGVRDDQTSRDLATAILVTGLAAPPQVVFNDIPLAGPLATVTLGGSTAYVIPLTTQPVDLKRVAARALEAEQALVNCTADRAASRESLIQSWAVIGPFPNEEGKGIATAYPPEQRIALEEPLGELAWRSTREPGTPVSGGAAVNLTQFVSAQQWVTAYAVTTLRADRARPASLFTSSEGAIAAWLNGKPILNQPDKRNHGCRPGPL